MVIYSDKSSLSLLTETDRRPVSAKDCRISAHIATGLYNPPPHTHTHRPPTPHPFVVVLVVVVYLLVFNKKADEGFVCLYSELDVKQDVILTSRSSHPPWLLQQPGHGVPRWSLSHAYNGRNCLSCRVSRPVTWCGGLLQGVSGFTQMRISSEFGTGVRTRTQRWSAAVLDVRGTSSLSKGGQKPCVSTQSGRADRDHHCFALNARDNNTARVREQSFF